jgi:hypothetical protein
MKHLLNELISDIVSLREADSPSSQNSKPGESSEFPGYFHRGGGYYSFGKITNPVTHMVDNNKMVPLTAKQQDALAKNEPAMQTEPTAPTPFTAQGGYKKPDAVLSKIFSNNQTQITHGNATISVRQLINPETGKEIDVSTTDGRTEALGVVDAHIESLRRPLQLVCELLSTKRATSAQRQPAKNFLGNMGELYAFRALLNEGVPTYMLPDSYPTNDLVILTEDVKDKTRGLKMVEISVKSSTGTDVVGGLGSNARAPLRNSVKSKELTIDNTTYPAASVIDASIDVYRQLMRFCTEGYVSGEQRDLRVPPTDKHLFDKKDLETALTIEGDRKQSAFLQARKLTTSDVSNFKNSALYKQIEKKNPALVAFIMDDLTKRTEENADLRFTDYQKIFTQQISTVLTDTDSSLSFESDLVAANFAPDGTLTQLTITPAEIMMQRVDADLKQRGVDGVSALEANKQLKLAGWRLSSRGLNVFNRNTNQPKPGYFGALVNVKPPTQLLRDTDRLTAKQFLEFVNTAQERATSNDSSTQTGQSVEDLAQVSDKALDDAYHYGRSTPGNNFGWLSNIESARAAKELIDAGETDIEAISSAIHDGWNKTAMADYNGELNLDTPTPDEKKAKRKELAKKSYAELPEEEKEKDRVVARALLDAITNTAANGNQTRSV